MARKRQTYPPARTATKGPPRPGAGPEGVQNRPNLVAIDLNAGKGRDVSVGARMRIAGNGRYAGEVVAWARRETELAELIAKRQPPNPRPIAEVPPRDVATVLGDWRHAERALSSEEAGTAAWEAARADVGRLRDEYRRSLEQRMAKEKRT